MAVEDIDEVEPDNRRKTIFSGWMFAENPGLNALEHPIYDVWLTDCKNPVVTATAPPEPPPAAQPAKPPAATTPRRGTQAQPQPQPQQPAGPPRR